MDRVCKVNLIRGVGACMSSIEISGSTLVDLCSGKSCRTNEGFRSICPHIRNNNQSINLSTIFSELTA